MQIDSRSFRALEEALLDPAVRGAHAALSAILADDFLEFGVSGRVFCKQDVLDTSGALPAVTVPPSDFEIHPLSDSAVLVTYRSTTREEDGSTRSAWRSSVWLYRDDRWQLRFHQGTLIGPSA